MPNNEKELEYIYIYMYIYIYELVDLTNILQVKI